MKGSHETRWEGRNRHPCCQRYRQSDRRALRARRRKVIIADLNLDAANGAADEIKSTGGEARGVAMDVTSEDAVDAGVAATIAAYGGVDILVSNAGIQIVRRWRNSSMGNGRR